MRSVTETWKNKGYSLLQYPVNNRDHERHCRELLCVLALQEAGWALGGFSLRLQVVVVCMICLAKGFVSDLT